MTPFVPITVLLLAARPSSSLLHPSKSTFNHCATALSSTTGRINTTLTMRSVNNQATTKTSTTLLPTKRIFCYGDSLTAGTTYPSDELFPYGRHLEKELNQCMLPPAVPYSSASMSESPVMVRWRGLPGWTASAMMDYVNDSSTGLQPVLDGIRNPSLSLVIILVGTNDIGSLTSSMVRSSSDAENAEDATTSAVDPILRLHRTCLDCKGDDGTKNIHTLAVGIPGSAWQEANPNASKLCTNMNQALQDFASSLDRVSYVDFPFSYERGDSKWSGDGLHLSEEGYENLGKRVSAVCEADTGQDNMILDSLVR